MNMTKFKLTASYNIGVECYEFENNKYRALLTIDEVCIRANARAKPQSRCLDFIWTPEQCFSYDPELSDIDHKKIPERITQLQTMKAAMELLDEEIRKTIPSLPATQSMGAEETGDLIIGEKLMKLKIKKLSENAVVPKQGSQQAAGLDLYACMDTQLRIEPKATVMVGTGLVMEIPDGYFGGIFARSGLACKHGVRPANCVGVVDSDYRGEVKVALRNDSNTPYIVEPGERIAQLVILPYLSVEVDEVDRIEDTDRGSGGFGSTGTK